MPLDDISSKYKAHRIDLGGRADGGALLDEVLGSLPSRSLAAQDSLRQAGDVGVA